MNRLALPLAFLIGVVALGTAWGEAVSGGSTVHGHSVAGALYCDDGYHKDGERCVALPKVANGGYLGSTLYCQDGYYNGGGRCAALPKVANGSYLGSALYCHDGYYKDGPRCVALPKVEHGGYLAVTLYCDDGYYSDGAYCVALPADENGAYVGDVRVCNDGFEIQDDRCVKSTGAADLRKRFDPATLVRSKYATAPVGFFDVFVDESPSLLRKQSSGSRRDAKSGSSFRWDRTRDGSAALYGMNFNSKSNWRTIIRPDGSMRGLDRYSNLWRYNASLGLYLNMGTGKICVVKETERSCL